jgi:hypothetical protein
MNDNQIRGLVLRYYYDHRRSNHDSLPSPSDIGNPPNVTSQDIVRICNQLADHGLIDWQKNETFEDSSGLGYINAHGVDVIEGSVKPPISINLDTSQNINISSSSNVSISGSNTQANNITLQDLISKIENVNAPNEQKEEARSLLRQFLTHPLVSSVAGGLTSLLG